MPIQDFSDFIAQHQLPESYLEQAQHWFTPLAQAIAEKQQKANKAHIVGINGSQGSGKSTLADYLALLWQKNYQLNVVVLSIDDFYFTLQQRQALSATIHPLLLTRGVPGTHDIDLAVEVIRSLGEGTSPTLVPRFNKATDDRFPVDEWDSVPPGTDIIILEGWCMGAQPQTENELMNPINELEKTEDPDRRWRHYVNRQLAEVYPRLFGLADSWVMLKAPSFDCVYQWRLEQENKLRDSLAATTDGTVNKEQKVMDSKAIGRFIQHYQRITEHLLKTLPDRVDYLFELDKNRKIISSNTSDLC